MTMHSERRPARRRSRSAGFTLLEVMAALAIVAYAVFKLLEIREAATNNAYVARNANLARSLAGQLLSEVEFRGISPLQGEIDGYPGFSYEVEITYENLVTGEKKDDETKKKEDNSFKPADTFDPGKEKQQEDDNAYLLRRVVLTLRYPDLKEAKDQGYNQLKVETLMPALPEEKKNTSKPAPFSSKN